MCFLWPISRRKRIRWRNEPQFIPSGFPFQSSLLPLERRFLSQRRNPPRVLSQYWFRFERKRLRCIPISLWKKSSFLLSPVTLECFPANPISVNFLIFGSWGLCDWKNSFLWIKFMLTLLRYVFVEILLGSSEHTSFFLSFCTRNSRNGDFSRTWTTSREIR